MARDNRPTVCPHCGKRASKHHTEHHIPRCAKNPAAMTTCPHCGKEGTHAAVAHHARQCPHNPHMLQAVRRVVAGEDGTAISSSEYYDLAKGTDLPALSTLERHFGGWGGVLKALGLRRGERRQRRQLSRREQEERFAQLDREIEAYMQWCRQVERAEKFGGHYEDTSTVEASAGGRRVRRFADGAAWDLPEPVNAQERERQRA